MFQNGPKVAILKLGNLGNLGNIGNSFPRFHFLVLGLLYMTGIKEGNLGNLGNEFPRFPRFPRNGPGLH